MPEDNIAERVLALFERELDEVKVRAHGVPEDIGILDPFHGDHASEVRRIVTDFHRQYYSDNKPRKLMLGINPGRLGAGSTGLSFTDTKRCESDLGIRVEGVRTHEPSSDFFYRMIRAYGGPQAFYSDVFVSSVVPLGFTIRNDSGNDVNINYYDRKDLQESLQDYIERWLRSLTAIGFRSDAVYCIGTGKNMKFLQALNKEKKLFARIIPLEHPRYVMQYKAKSLDLYVEKYIRELAQS